MIITPKPSDNEVQLLTAELERRGYSVNYFIPATINVKINITKFEKMETSEKQKSVVQLAKQYYEDSKYYLKKGDYFTAFGCINYAHGLLDGIIKF